MNDRERIIAYAASKNAAVILQGTGDVTGYPAAVAAIRADLEATVPVEAPLAPLAPVAGPVVEYSAASAAGAAAQALAAPPVAALAAAPVQTAEAVAIANLQAAGVVGVLPVTAETDVEGLWQNLFTNPNDWFDNRGDARASSQGGAGPDFRHKTVQKNGYGLGLWLVSVKYGKTAPEWVFGKLGIPVPVVAPVAPVGVPAGAPALPVPVVFGPDEAPF